jgi:hypothetical protein
VRTTQEKFFGLIEAGLHARYELVVDHDFSNTGTARIQPRNSIKTLRQVKFSFDTSATHLTITPPLKGIGRTAPDGSTIVYATSPGELQTVVDYILEDLRAYDNHVNGETK